MTPTIFGSTVGYPSDSLASCFFRYSAFRNSAFYPLPNSTVDRVPVTGSGYIANIYLFTTLLLIKVWIKLFKAMFYHVCPIKCALFSFAAVDDWRSVSLKADGSDDGSGIMARRPSVGVMQATPPSRAPVYDGSFNCRPYLGVKTTGRTTVKINVNMSVYLSHKVGIFGVLPIRRNPIRRN